jgi:addiction module HigA family antidote
MPSAAVHPGKVLKEQLETIGVSPSELARQIDVPANRISQIIHGKRAITGDTALRLAHWFKTPPDYWLGLQIAFDLRLAERAAGTAIQKLPTRPANAVTEPNRPMRSGRG